MTRIVGLRALAALAIVACAVPDARADLINITTYTGNQAAGGLTILANYDTAAVAGFGPLANVRYIQLVMLTDGMGNTVNTVPGYPNGTFIDPQPNQNGPGSFDNLPWYDATYNTAADQAANANRQFGAGSFYYDQPSGWSPFKPITFSATTAIVLINPINNQFQILGGFTWGFSINAAGTLSLIPASTTVNNDAATRRAFNGALATGPATFSAWTAVSSVPEPSTVLMTSLGVAFAGLIGLRRGRAARRAA